jgi:hypothetical protein
MMIVMSSVWCVGHDVDDNVREGLEEGQHGFMLKRLRHRLHLLGLAAARSDRLVIGDEAGDEVVHQFHRRFILLLDTNTGVSGSAGGGGKRTKSEDSKRAKAKGTRKATSPAPLLCVPEREAMCSVRRLTATERLVALLPMAA